MKKIATAATAAVLVLSLDVLASDQSGKPSASSQTGAGAPQNPGQFVAKPDFAISLEGQYVIVANKGAIDWSGAVDVVGTCKSTAPAASSEACGNSFPNGHFGYHMASILPGHGAAVVPALPAVSGPGWRAIPMGLPPGGTYNVSFTVDPHNKIPDSNPSNNTITKTITIPGIQPVTPRHAN